MGVRDYIEQQKTRFFGARDMDKLELQKQELEAQRRKLEVERKSLAAYESARQAVRKEKEQIRELAMAPKRERRAAVFAGLQRFKNATSKANQVFQNVDKGVSKLAPGNAQGQKNFGIKPSGIFADAPAQPKKGSSGGKTIVIRIKE